MSLSDIIFKPFGPQSDFLRDDHRFLGAFAGKRGGKTEAGAIKGIKLQEEKPNGKYFSIDPYLGAIIAPTNDMLRRLSLKKFLAYAKPFYSPDDYNKSEKTIIWHDKSEIYGLSADKPERIEGIKAGWIWIDEVFQVKEALFLEAMARVADTEGYLFCTGSLGPQIVNPKKHWAYQYFKQNPDDQTKAFEWTTAQNPFFPRKELARLKAVLDPVTFRASFEITWDTVPSTAVYHNLSDINFQPVTYNPDLPTFISIDWGWAHPMAVGFFQYDKSKDMVFMIDEIVGSRITLEELAKKIFAKPYKIAGWYCDIAGNQEREQTGKSNIRWFKENHQIEIKYRRTAVTYGIPIVRSYIKNGLDQAKFFINPFTCKKTVDGLQQYAYAEKDGEILNENPIKKDDDTADMVRYFFVNLLDPKILNQPPQRTIQL